MKRSSSAITRQFEGLSIFAADQEDPETYFDLIERAQEEIEDVKLALHHKAVGFAYDGGTVRGKFVTALEGDYPGTFMIVLRVPSSRICAGPCFLSLHGERVGGIVVTGNDGLVGITMKAGLGRRVDVIPFADSVTVAAA
jgi:hypothetical protein